MSYRTKAVTRREARNIIESIELDKFSNEGLAQILEIISVWHGNTKLSYNNYIVKD